MLSLTTGGPQSIYSADGLNGDMDMILFPINHGILYFAGIEVLPPFIAYARAHLDDQGREGCLEQHRSRLHELQSTEPIPYPTLDA